MRRKHWPRHGGLGLDLTGRIGAGDIQILCSDGYSVANITDGAGHTPPPYGGDGIAYLPDAIYNPYAVQYDNNYIVATHLHTTNSDGAETPAVMAAAYKAAGYHALIFTDHDFVTGDPGVDGILGIGGAEETAAVDSRTRHMCALGIATQSVSADDQTIINATIAQGGLMVLAHPMYSGFYWDLDWINKINNITGLEIIAMMGGTNETLWDSLLSLRKVVWGFASDDAHALAAVNDYGNIIVNAPSLTQTEIIRNIAKGNFYCREADGPTLTITLSGSDLIVTTPEASTITFIKENGAVAQTEASVTTSTYTIIGDEVYVRGKIIRDSDGLVAFTQPLLIGNTWDVSAGKAVNTPSVTNRQINLNSEMLTLDGYAETNADGTIDIGAGKTYQAVGQSFESVGETLYEVQFYLTKVGTFLSSDAMYAKLYTHQDTFGVDGVPDTLLATSDPVAANVARTTARWEYFTFPLPIVLTAGTKYFVVIEFTGGDAANYIKVAHDESAPSHGGNAALYDGAWAEDAAKDVCFQLAYGLIGYTLGVGWTIAAGEAVHVAGTASNLTVNGLSKVCAGKWYRCEINATAADTIWTFRVGNTGAEGAITVPAPATGIKKGVIRAITSNSPVIFGGSTTNLTIAYSRIIPLELNELISGVQLSRYNIHSSIEITIPVRHFQGGVAICMDKWPNPYNFILAYYDRRDETVYLEKCVGGTYTMVNRIAKAYGASRKVEVKKVGTSIKVYYNDELVLTETISDASIIYNTLHGRLSTGDSSEVQLDNFVVKPYYG